MLDLQTIATASTSAPTDNFAHRHNGPTPQEVRDMLAVLGYGSLDELIDRIVPPSIRLDRTLDLPAALSETEAIAKLRAIASQNHIFRSYLGQGYHDCITPPVIQRNVLENPGWYTAYTPYQAEIAQGRLEALLNFQTMVMDLTGLEIANASLLDEGTAAAEAMSMSLDVSKAKNAHTFFIDRGCHPQTIAVVQTRAIPLGIEVILGDWKTFDFADFAEFSATNGAVFGALLQYPTTSGQVEDYRQFVETAHAHQAIVTVAADILSLALLTPPGEFGADIAVGTTQRLGVPLGFGGPHAAYFATKADYQRKIPGRVVGVSKDVHGNPALRLALQTREQHIRRDKATSNICTAQVLLAVMASMYAVYHGPVGLEQIAQGIHDRAVMLAIGLEQLGYTVQTIAFFDTIAVTVDDAAALLDLAKAARINLRQLDATTIGISLDETTSDRDICDLLELFSEEELFEDEETAQVAAQDLRDRAAHSSYQLIRHDAFHRTSSYLTEPVFNRYHSETEMLRYLHRLQNRDLSLTQSMIPLGSCTMKLNATAEMIPVTWPEFGKLHPFAPAEQTQGYRQLFQQLETWLAEITGFAAISLQPNAGSQGEYAGLQAIRAYHQSRGDRDRSICLIPESAHGTNPASAVMCGMKVIAVKCDPDGNIDLDDLTAKADHHRDRLAALMVTYPSTHGVFEAGITDICQIIHDRGGQVYMDGANMNAQVGLCRPGDFGADVCHLNLHKTFCIPHGGGGPGVGPIGVMAHLAPFLPGHPVTDPQVREADTNEAIGPISAAPWGSASILPISWMYIAMMGADGLAEATKLAILNANYIAAQLDAHYPVLYKGNAGLVAHECILDLRSLRKSADITVEDIAKRLMDYGYHAPTVSWPVAGTVMVEPTESESKAELDRFCTAMIGIRQEIAAIEAGESDRADNPLKHAPHTAQSLICGDWDHGYARELGAYPADWTKADKFWPVVGRIDSAFGDRNLVCSCVGMEAYRA